MFACSLFEYVVFHAGTVSLLHVSHPLQDATTCQARGICGTTLGILNEHTGQQWLSQITEIDVWPNNGWCKTMRLWAEAWY